MAFLFFATERLPHRDIWALVVTLVAFFVAKIVQDVGGDAAAAVSARVGWAIGASRVCGCRCLCVRVTVCMWLDACCRGLVGTVLCAAPMLEVLLACSLVCSLRVVSVYGRIVAHRVSGIDPSHTDHLVAFDEDVWYKICIGCALYGAILYPFQKTDMALR